MCSKSVDELKCKKCNYGRVVKNGKSRNNSQRFICNICRYSFQRNFTYESYNVNDHQIVLLTKEGCGIRSTARILSISPKTILRRIIKIARNTKRPYTIFRGKTYEVDEMFTYVKHKDNRICIAYSFEVGSGNVIDFMVGRRPRSSTEGKQNQSPDGDGHFGFIGCIENNYG